MTSYCTILLNQATKSDVLAACVQADAALQAGLAQATAATHAGYWTFGAGIFALIGGGLAFLAARNQIKENRQEQSKQRRHDLKREVYVAAIKALATGLEVVVRMANLEIRAQDVLSVYNDRIGDLVGVHLVAELTTASKFLDCVQRLGAMHILLNKQRPFQPNGQYQIVDLINWSRKCTAALADVIPSMTLAVAAMRAELDLPIDADEYKKLILASVEKTLAGSEQLFSELLSG